MKKKFTLLVVTLFVLVFQLQIFPSLVLPETDSVSERLNKLEKEIQKLKEKSSAPSPVTVGGQAFLYYTYTTNGIEGNDFNRFDFERMYINIRGDISQDSKFMFTSDIYRNTTTGTYYSGLAMRVKYAYYDYSPLKYLSLKIGMIPTTWVGYIDSYWKYRVLSSSFTDKNKYFASSDLGFSATYTLPEKLGDVTAFILNGEGYTSNELNRYKDFAARLSLTPFSSIDALQGITLGEYYYKGSYQSKLNTADPKNRAGSFIGYNDKYLSANIEYNYREDGDSTKVGLLTIGYGLSYFGEFKYPFSLFTNRMSLVWRLDIADPNRSKGSDMTRYGIIGLTYKLNDKVQLVLDHQFQHAEASIWKKANGSRTNFDEKWFVHSLINF